MTKYKGKTIHQSAAKLLERMKHRAAAAMAENYCAQSDPETTAHKHWREVADLLHQTHTFETNAIYSQAEQDAKEMTQKQSKQKPTQTPSPTPEQHAEAQLAREEADRALDRCKEACKALDRKLTSANNALAIHIRDMGVNPVHALECAPFKAAAIIQVFTYAIQGLTDDDGKPVATKSRSDSREGLQIWDTVPYVREYAQKEVNRRSQDASTSTSQTTNIMQREILAAWADVIEIIDWRS